MLYICMLRNGNRLIKVNMNADSFHLLE
jgi:hypothetical protein